MEDRIHHTENRHLEFNPITAEVLTTRSRFAYDYMHFVAHCLRHNNFRHDVRKQLNLRPEPLAVDYEKVGVGLPIMQHAMDFVRDNIHSWEWLYKEFADDLSKDLLLVLLAYRAIGYRHVKLPLNGPAFFTKLQEVGRQYLATPDPADPALAELKLKEFDVTVGDEKLKVLTRPFGLINEFEYSQYVYRGAEIFGPRPGDVVLDCGACFGGTSLFFAASAGAGGEVYSFEFFPQNLEIFRKHLDMNPSLRDRIHIVEHPVWRETGQKMFMRGSGPEASIVPQGGPGDREVSTYAIDDLVEERGLRSVDFIKMDIEGAEIAALNGAARSIKKYKPRLAISVYHKLHDFYHVPKLIKSFRDDYKFYLQHSTPHVGETVVFAV